MKYSTFQKTVPAIYDNSNEPNPFLAALPDFPTEDDFFQSIQHFPNLPAQLNTMSRDERRQLLPALSTVFIPMKYMYEVFIRIFQLIRNTYLNINTIDYVRKVNALYKQIPLNMCSTHTESGALLGVPGIGKTSTIKRCLSVLPQVISHEKYMGEPFLCQQVMYLHLECPADCSIKALAFNFISALDDALGTDYLTTMASLRSISTSAIAAQFKILCLTHHIGILVIDEIQNVVTTAAKNRQIKPLVRFLVELTNDIGVSVCFVGTPDVEELFLSQEHLKRRTRGFRLLPLLPDGSYLNFLKQIWPLQVTERQAILTDALAHKI